MFLVNFMMVWWYLLLLPSWIFVFFIIHLFPRVEGKVKIVQDWLKRSTVAFPEATQNIGLPRKFVS